LTIRTLRDAPAAKNLAERRRDLCRRSPVRSGSTGSGAAATPAPASAPAAQHPRNIIFVLVDDLRFDGMGFLQPKGLLHTPNIDAMAAQGTYFPNGVTTSSLCSPARASILTGMTARNHGVVDNNNSTEEGLTFFPAYLQQAGYQTAFFGKWHMGNDTDAPAPASTNGSASRDRGTISPRPTCLRPPSRQARATCSMSTARRWRRRAISPTS
jgi:hypothetical protein